MADRRYPAVGNDPRELRPRRSNGIAALALVAFVVVVIVAVALFG